MTDLKYIVNMTHDEKGIGFVAKTALQNSQRQTHSPIRQAKFAEEATNNKSSIEVTIDDGTLTKFISDAITHSGRMPNDKNSFRIESIELDQVGGFKEKVRELERQGDALQRQMGPLREENAKLRHETATRAKIKTPVDGLLEYFGTRNYSVDPLLADPVEVDFARRVVCEHVDDSFLNYVNHALGKALSKEEIDKALEYKAEEPEDLKGLKDKYETAKTELAFLAKLQEGSFDVPASLREEYSRIIEQKGHTGTIEAYEARVRERRETEKFSGLLRGLQEKYGSVHEQLGLLSQASESVEAVFNGVNGRLEIYFPFVSRNVKAGFSDDLRKELQVYFGDSKVEQIEGKFLAYGVAVVDRSKSSGHVTKLIEDLPFTLRVAGFKSIMPYRLGV